MSFYAQKKIESECFRLMGNPAQRLSRQMRDKKMRRFEVVRALCGFQRGGAQRVGSGLKYRFSRSLLPPHITDSVSQYGERGTGSSKKR
jgi:hypothetical protein